MTEELHERRSVDLALDNLRRETDYRFETVNQRFVAAEAAVQAALAAAKEAVVLANLANEKRFDLLSEKIDVLTKSMNTVAGRASGMNSTVGWIMGAVTVFLTIVVIVANIMSSR